MPLSEIDNLSNQDLLELFADIVRIEHYDPFETPQFATDLHNNGIYQDDIFKLVLERMRDDACS